MRKSSKKKSMNFLLENESSKRLSLIIYLGSVGLIVLLYFTIIILFSTSSAIYTITGLSSVLIGIYMVFNKDKWVRKLSLWIHEQEIKKRKKDGRENLSSTLKRITPKRKDFSMKIKGRKSPQEYLEKLKSLFSQKKKKKGGEEYIEYKD